MAKTRVYFCPRLQLSLIPRIKAVDLYLIDFSNIVSMRGSPEGSASATSEPGIYLTATS